MFTEAGAWHTGQITAGVIHTNAGHISTAKRGLRLAEIEKESEHEWKQSPVLDIHTERNSDANRIIFVNLFNRASTRKPHVSQSELI